MKLSGVGKRFGSRTVLRDISLEIFPGTVTLLAGANGAGKSTLLRIMAGLARPTRGSVINTFEASDSPCASPDKAAPNERLPNERLPDKTEPDETAPDKATSDKAGQGETRQGREAETQTGIGYLGHATFIYPGLSALENLAFWGSLHGCDTSRERLLATLRRVELGRFAEERAGAFSRGMAQRLNLARILLLAPRLLLLDEPGTGLDTDSQSLLRGEIGKARARGAAIVWISHDLAGDAACADRLIRLADQRISYDGAPTTAEAGLAGRAAGTPEQKFKGAACRDSA